MVERRWFWRVEIHNPLTQSADDHLIFYVLIECMQTAFLLSISMIGGLSCLPHVQETKLEIIH